MRPWLGKEYLEFSQTFLTPAIDFFIAEKEKGNDYLLYDAPLAIYFHVSPYADPLDPVIAATYAMISAETLGLGTCMIGTVAMFQRKEAETKIRYTGQESARDNVNNGYPAIKYQRGIDAAWPRLLITEFWTAGTFLLLHIISGSKMNVLLPFMHI